MKKMMGIMALVMVFACSSVYSMGPDEEGEHRGGPQGKRGGHGGNRMHHKEVMHEIMSELGLSQEQKEEIKKLREEKGEISKQLREELHSKKIALKIELDKPESDQAKITGLIDELTAVQKRLTEERVKSVLDMKKVLTPEQFQLLNQKMAIKKEVHKQMREMKHGNQKKGSHQRGPGGPGHQEM